MRIVNQPIPAIHKAYDQQKKSAGLNNPGSGKLNDDIELSTEAKLWGIASKALRELPETAGNIAELKQAVASGTYQVNNDELAEIIWQESGFDKKA
jgi:anti-sigma28 factor (negative regulator of flagellin synthesis)